MYENEQFSIDKPRAEFLECDNECLLSDDNGEPAGASWDDADVVQVDDTRADAFDTDEFIRLTATVARPIAQPYTYTNADGETDVAWLKKPRDELRNAAWSLDNAYWTHGHPDTETGMVKSVDDVRGFWSNSRYDTDDDGLKSDLHIPVTDDESKERIAETRGVSVGFRHRNTRTDEYDGEVGSVTDEEPDLDGYQTDILFDHCASVDIGRCPTSKGCGLHTVDEGLPGVDAETHGRMQSFKRTSTTGPSKDDSEMGESSSDKSVAGVSFTGASDGKLDESRIPNDDFDGHYLFDGDTKSESSYPVVDADGNLRRGNVESAHELGARGGVSADSLERKLKALNDEFDNPPIDFSENDTMTEDNTDEEETNDIDIGVDSFSLDYLAAQNDEVSDAVERIDELESETDKLEGDLETVMDALDAEDVDEATETAEDLIEARQNQREEERDELVGYLTDNADYDEEELDDMGLDSLRDKKDTIEKALPDTDESTASPDTDDGKTGEDTEGANDALPNGSRRIEPDAWQ